MSGMYDCTAGRLRAVAAALRRFLHDSTQGDVPIVKPWEADTTLWKVWSMGREMRADWFVIQRCRTDSKELAKTILFGYVSLWTLQKSCVIPYPVTHSNLEHWSVLLCPSLCYFCVICPELIQAAKYRKAGYLGKTFDVW